MASVVVRPLDARHDDFVHDVAYDFYGQRLATCASDLTVHVFDWSQEAAQGKGDWTENDKFKAHDASVLRVTWAHPEFGQVLATASVDRHVRIWEEQEHEPLQSGRRWAERARLTHNRTVQDVKFAPKHLGLKLATCSADGAVRIYEAMDVMNLALWNLMDTLAVVQDAKEQEGNFCLSWCPSKFHPAMLAIGCGRENAVKIYRQEEGGRQWQAIEVLGGHNDVVHDVSWAPTLGRSYHLIATACKDSRVRIFKVRGDAAAKERLTVELKATLADHEAEVWKVEWNVTGTVLSSSGDDGKVRLWKANAADEWACIAVVAAGQSAGPPS